MDPASGADERNEDARRVAYLFKLYEKLALAPLLEPAEAAPARKPQKARPTPTKRSTR